MNAGDHAVRVLLVDDHAIVRKGVRALLQTEQDIEVVGEAEDGQRAISLADALTPDVILMDLMMPGIDGVEAIRQIIARQPSARIVVVTSFATDDKVFPAIRSGALGYLLKDSAPDDLVRAIRQAHRGEAVLHPAIAMKVLEEIGRPGQPTKSVDPLSEREVEVLRLVARGMSNREIADSLSVSEATVRTHVSSILSKLHLASRVQATLYALREGIASLSDKDHPVGP
jgi:two-component system, NarL family, response regulator LiaR